MCTHTRAATIQAYTPHRGILALSTSTNTNIITVAQHAWKDFVQLGSTVVDATAGNGGDTLWLANAVGAHGTVYVFDKQVQLFALPTGLLAVAAVLAVA